MTIEVRDYNNFSNNAICDILQSAILGGVKKENHQVTGEYLEKQKLSP